MTTHKSQKLMILDQPNKNGRVYTTELVNKIIETVSGDVYGTIGLSSEGTIDLERISHKTTNLRIEDGYWVGDITILDTRHGYNLRSLIDTSLAMGNTIGIDFRPTGYSTINVDGIIDVNAYKLISIDAVNDGA